MGVGIGVGSGGSGEGDAELLDLRLETIGLGTDGNEIAGQGGLLVADLLELLAEGRHTGLHLGLELGLELGLDLGLERGKQAALSQLGLLALQFLGDAKSFGSLGTILLGLLVEVAEKVGKTLVGGRGIVAVEGAGTAGGSSSSSSSSSSAASSWLAGAAAGGEFASDMVGTNGMWVVAVRRS